MKFDITEVKIEIYTPEEYVVPMRDALTQIGACKIGNYDHVVSYQDTKGYWKPLEESTPFNGEKGRICSGTEVKLEIRCPMERAADAVRLIQDIHPYEEPVINVLPLLNGSFDL